MLLFRGPHIWKGLLGLISLTVLAFAQHAAGDNLGGGRQQPELPSPFGENLGACLHDGPASSKPGGTLTVLAIFLAGASTTAILLGVAACIWLLRRRRRQGRLATAGGTEQAECHAAVKNQEERPPAPDLGVAATKLGLGAPNDSCHSLHGEALPLLGTIFADAPSPQWSDVVLPREAVSLCLTPSGAPTKLGKGASGEVFKAMLHGTTPVAVKVVQLNGEDESFCGQRWFVQEASMLWQLNHPHIVQFLGVTSDGDRGMLIMELMRRGDLAALMSAQMPNKSGRLLGWYNRGRRVAAQVAAGLAFLHSRGLLHLDIKPANILLSADFTAKIGDVGFCRAMRDGRVANLGDRLGTFNWAAPEVLLGQPATDKSDVFSFGVLLWQILSGELAARGTIYPLTTPRDCPPEVAALQQRCLAADPSLRPTAAEVARVLSNCQATQAPEAPAAAPLLPKAAAPAAAAAAAPAGKRPALRALRLDKATPCYAVPLAEHARALMAASGSCAKEPTFFASPLVPPPCLPPRQGSLEASSLGSAAPLPSLGSTQDLLGISRPEPAAPSEGCSALGGPREWSCALAAP